MKQTNRHQGFGSFLAAAIVAFAITAPAEAEQSGYWRQAYGSGPASYQPISQDALKQMAEKMKIPFEVIAEMGRRTTASGTLRFHCVVSAGGSKVRVRLSNEQGTGPLLISGASVGLAGEGFDARAGSLKPLTFSGRQSISIPAGAPALSDPVELNVAPETDLVVSVYVKNELQFDARGLALVAAAPGDQTLADGLKDRKDFPGRPLVTGIDVLSPQPLQVIAVLGDSLSDGNRPQITPFQSWPEVLAERLNAGKDRGKFAVVNAGIAGNQLLSTAAGEAGLSRLDRDVLRIEGLSWVILLEGENDIGMAGHSLFGGDNPPLAPEDLIAGYRQVIARAHARGAKVAMATMLPFGGAPTHFNPENERIRNAVNQWIRTSHEPDVVFDFEALARDPQTPTQLGKAFDSGDHLHPGAEGFKALAGSIDLAVFSR